MQWILSDTGRLPPCIRANWSRFVVFSYALSARIRGHYSQVLVLLAFGAHKKGCDKDTFRAVFPSIWVGAPKHNKTKENAKTTNRPVLTPPPAVLYA